MSATIDIQTINLVGLADARVPYFEQWFGLWAMHEEYFQALAQKVHGYDLNAHLARLPQNVSNPADIKAVSDGSGGSRPYQLTAEGIAIVPIRGTLMKHQSSMSSATSTVLARRQIRDAAAASDVRAILLHVESPGGTVAGTRELAEDIAAAQAKKPTWSYVEDLCASAAYWLSSQTSRIAANTMALVGSIGTYGVVYDYSAAAAQQGVKVHVVRAGAFKGAGTPGAPVSDAQIADYQRLVDSMNDHFLSAVESGRKRNREQIKQLADGRVHMATAAKDLGLIDAVESMDETLAQLRASLDKPSSKGKTKMSTENTPTAPVAASLDEITAACAGADDSFVLAQLKAKATVAQATSAWMKALGDRNAALAKSLDEEKAKQTTTTTPPTATKKPGVDPVTSGKASTASDADASDPVAAWDEAVEAQVKTGKSRAKAIAYVVSKNPELHQSYLAAYNEQHAPAARSRK